MVELGTIRSRTGFTKGHLAIPESSLGSTPQGMVRDACQIPLSKSKAETN